MIDGVYADIITLIAAGIGIYAYYPYIRDVLRGKTRPHLFSWAVWGLVMGITFCAQLADGGGSGAWVTGVIALLNGIVTVLAIRYGEKTITRSDKIMLTGALSAIPLWLATSDPLWSVLLVSLIDMAGFVPTFRKSWHKPYEETLKTYVLAAVSFVLSLVAMGTLTTTTVMAPVVVIVANICFTAMVLYRRRSVNACRA